MNRKPYIELIFSLAKISFAGALALSIAAQEFLQIQYWRWFLHSVLIISLLIILSQVFIDRVGRQEVLKPLWKNILASSYVLISLFLILELIFTFVPKSLCLPTLADNNWFGYYWKTNEEGYRDSPFYEKDTTKSIIAFLGDSFTAGHGINDPERRFSNILGKRLERDFIFFNLGVNGSDTYNQYLNLRAFQHHPDILILQYFGNDIETPEIQKRFPKPEYNPYEYIPLPLEIIVRGSYLLNYFFWKFPPPSYSVKEEQRNYIESTYGNPAILEKHLSHLEMISSFCQENQIKLMVLVFPILNDVHFSKKYIQPVQRFFGDKGVPVIDVSPIISAMEFDDRIVNSQNIHPRKELNELVAVIVYNRFKALGWVK